MTDSGRDDEFEAYLKRRASLKEGSTPPEGLEPPPELDRIIIGNARKAIQSATPMPFYRAPKWALPVGLAATIIISFAVMLELGMRARQQKQIDAPAHEPVATDLYAEAPEVVNAPAIAITAPQAADHPRLAKRGTAGARAGVRHIRLPPIPTVPWPPAVTPNTTSVVAAAAQPPADKARTRLARAEVAAARSRIDTESAGDAAAEAPAAPGPWLSQIEKLRNEGRTAEAEQEIKRFRAAFPAYPVPAESSSADDRAQ
jgi:hypothetical protein